MRITSDYHMHSEHSGDSTAPMRSMIESSINKGLNEICFTEHMDLDYPIGPDNPEGFFEIDADAYREDFLKCKEEYKGKIDLHFGIELGLQPHIVKENTDFLNKYPFEFIIGSNHLCNHKDPYYPSFYEGRSSDDAIREFFESTLENIKYFHNFDVLGHLDYIVRYLPNPDDYNFQNFSDIIDEILNILISENKGLDVNTKSFQSGMNDPNPCIGILARFYELGGRIITFGSDAHKPEHIAYDFERARQTALKAGFTSYCTFADRKPVFHDL
ncbi:MAG: histidinol-phosphatase HisJ family protein [Butyrivibrio sp.]|uniref:histidinol-phosphatase HisJ family protein n=1 Tax=Butyrivibrio sp. TaxID=28121 RepID=UPI0025F18514|nr:histidinol-phosphatase HisJ family protein [Butyrivibrio sp.]MCR5772083.1 histidinol-phosphatase HisJ family protein [Butyrivibrio sp.]